MSENVLTFTIDNNHYGVNVNSVIEVLDFSTPTAVPCAEPYIEGLIYSREQGITVVNLKKRFGLSDEASTDKNKIIVVEIPSPTEEDENNITLYGLVADSVQDVITIDKQELKCEATAPIPDTFIEIVYKYNDETVFNLELSQLFVNTETL